MFPSSAEYNFALKVILYHTAVKDHRGTVFNSRQMSTLFTYKSDSLYSFLYSIIFLSSEVFNFALKVILYHTAVK